ncbi:MAG: carbohydrate kinase family protein [bacterium]
MTSPVVAVIGTVNRDVIVTAEGAEHTSLGGILYNVLPLVALLEDTGLRVAPIGRLGAGDRDEAIALLRGFAALDPSGLIVDAAGTNVSHLDYRGGGERIEHVAMNVASLGGGDLVAAAPAQAVLVNMISGRDVSLEALEALRATCDGTLYLDVQALARTTDTPRRPRAEPEWVRWAAVFDVIRGNEDEIGWIAGTGGDVEAGVRRLLHAGAGEVLVTAGSRGASRFVLEGSDVRRDVVPAVPVARVADPTGCGDSFLSAVVAGRLLGLAPLDSVALGAWLASEVATRTGLSSLRELRGVRKRAAAADPRFATLLRAREGTGRPPG